MSTLYLNRTGEVPNEFTSYNLTPQQKLEGSTLTDDQLKVIQTEHSTVAAQLLGLTYDPKDPTQFGLDQAFLRGQLSTFQWLMEASIASKQELLEIAQRNQDQ